MRSVDHDDLTAPHAPDVRALRAAKAVLAAAFATLLLGGIMIGVGGAAPPRSHDANPAFATAIVGFELARSGEDVFAQIGPRDHGAHRRGIERTLLIDFAFLFAYPAWQLALVIYLLRHTKRRSRLAPIASLLTLFTAIGDGVENATMLALMRYDDAASIPRALLTWLDVSTCVKWTSCFAVGLVLAWSIAHAMRATRGAFVALVPSVASVLGLIGLFARSPLLPDLRPIVEMAMNGLVLTWLGVTVHVLVCVRRSR